MGDTRLGAASWTAAGLRLVLLVTGTVRENGGGCICVVVKRKAPIRGNGEGFWVCFALYRDCGWSAN